MDNNLIKINVQDQEGNQTQIEVPTDISLSLMEVLKGMDYHILATCGGMALCATCHVQVISGYERLTEPNDDEWAMLDTLPKLTQTSRLSCQVKVNTLQEGMSFRLLGETQL
jgi:2Fe-2S ferredoxin